MQLAKQLGRKRTRGEENGERGAGARRLRGTVAARRP